MKGMKNVDFDYTWAGRRDTGNWACERLPEISFSGTPGLREIIPTELTTNQGDWYDFNNCADGNSGYPAYGTGLTELVVGRK